MKKACELFVVATCVAAGLRLISEPTGQALQLLALGGFGLRCGWALVATIAGAIPPTAWELRRYQAEESEQTQRSLEHKRSRRFTIN